MSLTVFRALRLVTLPISALISATVLAQPGDSVPEAENFRHNHKLTAQVGFGPEDTVVGADEAFFTALRYQPTLRWFWPDSDWPTWEVFTRTWFDYQSSQNQTALLEDNRTQVDGTSAELREFYVKRHRLFGHVGWSLNIGRQNYTSDYGIWWDDSLESVRLIFNDDSREAFIALGQRFHTYNTSTGSLEANQEDRLYLFGQYRYRWTGQHWAGLRAMQEVDYGDAEIGSPATTATRVGIYLNGSTDPLQDQVWDYRLDTAVLSGSAEQADGTDDSVSGWAVIAEGGTQFEEVSGRPRLGLRLGITDTASSPFDGFYLNDMQSTRVLNEDRPATGLSGSYDRLNFSNLLFYGVIAELEPARRTHWESGLFQVNCRDDRGLLPMGPVLEGRSQQCRDSDVGQVLDTRLTYNVYPFVYGTRTFNWQWVLSATFYRAGPAIDTDKDDFQISLSTELVF